MKSWLRLSTVVILLFNGGGVARAMLTMNILSETHHVQGYLDTEPTIQYSLTKEYPVAGSVERRVQWDHLFLGTVNPDGEYYAGCESRTDRYKSGDSIIFEVEEVCGPEGAANSPMYFYTYAWSSITIDFMLTGPDTHLTIDTSGYAVWGQSYADAILTDLTTLDTWVLLYLELPGEPTMWFSGQTTIEVSKEHVYRMFMQADGRREYSPAHGRVEFQNVGLIPAPGAIVLGGIGVCLVGWLRRRRTF